MKTSNASASINNECMRTREIDIYTHDETERDSNQPPDSRFIDRTKGSDYAPFTKQICVPSTDSSIIY